MNLYEEFKNKTGLRTQEIERETGYTRQGLIYALNRLENEGLCSKVFSKSMDNLIRQLIFDESERHMNRINELQAIQAKLQQKV